MKPSEFVKEPLKCWGYNGPHIFIKIVHITTLEEIK